MNYPAANIFLSNATVSMADLRVNSVRLNLPLDIVLLIGISILISLISILLIIG